MNTSVAHSFFRQVENNAAKQALVCDGLSLDYAELGRSVARCSNTLLAKGVETGDHIGLLLPNSINFVVLMLAAADLGAVIVPLDISLPPVAVHKAFSSSAVRHLIALPRITEELSSQKASDFSFVDGFWGDVDTLMVECDQQSCEEHRLLADEDQAFILTMTSGSTGDPKPIVLTHRTKLRRAEAAVATYAISSEDRILAATPLYHSLAERLVLLPLMFGATSILIQRFSAREWIDCVNEQQVSFTIAVSSQLELILAELKKEAGLTFNSLRCLVSSSALLQPETKSALLNSLACDIHECYGASEIGVASNLYAGNFVGKLASVGVSAPGAEIRIIDKEGSELAANEVGEIVCKSSMAFGGYYQREDLTTKANWQGFFRTGDLGMLDSDGFLYFKGRDKDIIITGGINVYPADIEAVVGQHEMVKECAAFSLPDDRLGEVVAVAVVAEDPENCKLRKVRHFCLGLLADFQQPRKVFVVNELPKNGMGKVMKFQLTKLFSEG